MTTEEGNRIIGWFDGKYKEVNPIEPLYLNNPKLWNNYLADSGKYKYHSDWNQLMPVVERINNLDGDYQYPSINIDSDRTFLHFGLFNKEPMRSFNNMEYGSKISATWQAVVQFIQWLNNQPPTTSP